MPHKRSVLLYTSIVGVLAMGLVMVGCSPATNAPNNNDPTNTPDDGDNSSPDNNNDPDQSDPVATKEFYYASPAGTSGLEIAGDEADAAKIDSFDPGAFVLTASDSEDPLAPAGVEDQPPVEWPFGDLVIDFEQLGLPADLLPGTGGTDSNQPNQTDRPERPDDGRRPGRGEMPPPDPNDIAYRDAFLGLLGDDFFDNFDGNFTDLWRPAAEDGQNADGSRPPIDGALADQVGLPSFDEFPFDAFLEEVPIDEFIPNLPPESVRGTFGEFAFGDVPPATDGFRDFPALRPDRRPGMASDLPDFIRRLVNADFVDFTDFVITDLLPELPTDFDPTTDVTRPQDTLRIGDFDSLRSFLPPGFMQREAVQDRIRNFAADHPLIAEDFKVNGDLEAAMFRHPPVPTDFDNFDFVGDMPQFDDLLTTYRSEQVGVPVSGQFVTTRTVTWPDGRIVRVSATTYIERVLDEALPLVEMEEGVYQTQWSSTIRVTRTANGTITDPETEEETTFERTAETVAQVVWTLIVQEVDSDGDGTVDQLHLTGSNEVTILEHDVEDSRALDFDVEEPNILMSMEFEIVLQVTTGTEYDSLFDSAGDDTASNDADSDPQDSPEVNPDDLVEDPQ